MKKVRIWYRKERQKWYGEYWAGGRRHPEAITGKGPKGRYKKDADKWQLYMRHKLNNTDWQGIVGGDWHTATRLFLEQKRTNVAPNTLVELHNSLKAFEALIGPFRTDLIQQAHIETFKRKRLDTVCKSSKKLRKKPRSRTVNKDLANLRTFLNWCVDSRIARKGIKFKMLRVPKRQFIPPSEQQLSGLFERARQECPPLYMRMVLGLVTGWRRGAVERLTLSDRGPRIDLERNFAVSYESKTGKEVIKALGLNVMRILCGYINWLPAGSKKLFPARWDGKIRNTWDKLRVQAGLPEFRFAQLRNMSVSVLGAKGESKEELQKALGHASYETTSKHYFGIDSRTQQRITKKLDDTFADAPSSF